MIDKGVALLQNCVDIKKDTDELIVRNVDLS
jgi:hypothetical protein